MVNGRWHFVGWINELGTTYVDKIITNKSVNYDMHMVSKKELELMGNTLHLWSQRIWKDNILFRKNVSIIRESKQAMVLIIS